MKRAIVLAITVVFLCGLVYVIGKNLGHGGDTVLDVLGILIVCFFGVTVVGALLSKDQQDVKSLLRDSDHPSQRPFWDDSDRI